jgi:hypothetical protein
VGSLRFRRSVKIAPGIRLNFNKRSVGISAGARGARYSVNSSGRRTKSVGIPGTGVSYRSQTGGKRRSKVVAGVTRAASPTRLVARAVGWLTILIFVLALLNGAPHFAGTAAGIGIIAYVLLRLLRGILDPLYLLLLTRKDPNE